MSEISFDNGCSLYADDCDPEDWRPCSCPVCGGFLSGDIYQDPLICKKCGSELVAIPCSEEFKESDQYCGEEGRICVAFKRENHKGHSKEERQTKRLVKEGHDKWKAFL